MITNEKKLHREDANEYQRENYHFWPYCKKVEEDCGRVQEQIGWMTSRKWQAAMM